MYMYSENLVRIIWVIGGPVCIIMST